MKALYVFAATLTASSLSSQVLHPNGENRFNNELNLANACKSATKHLALFGKPVPPLKECRGWLRSMGPQGRVWEVTDAKLTFEVRIDSVSGDLLSYYDVERRADHYKGKGRGMRPKFEDEKLAKVHIERIAKNLGLDTKQLKDLTLRLDGHMKDGVSGGYFGCSFYDGKGRQVATLTCDPVDGRVLSYVRNRAFEAK